MHRLRTDEVLHVYLIDLVEMLQPVEDGSGRRIHLGSDIGRGLALQVLVPRGGVWQGARLFPQGHHAPLGTMMAPECDVAGTESGDRNLRQRWWPAVGKIIDLLDQY
ncbi:MAG: cupin domain-containing protein [Chloroflexota bacterium]|nr:cupin domain-containing protein [Chloroflexota bacterium]